MASFQFPIVMLILRLVFTVFYIAKNCTLLLATLNNTRSFMDLFIQTAFRSTIQTLYYASIIHPKINDLRFTTAIVLRLLE
jgi:hypothetical protein